MRTQKQTDQQGKIHRIAKMKIDTTGIVPIVMVVILLLFAISIAVGVEIPWQLFTTATVGLLIMYRLRIRSENDNAASTLRKRWHEPNVPGG